MPVAVFDDENDARPVGDVVDVTGGPGVVPASARRSVVGVDVGEVHDGEPGPDFVADIASGDVAQQRAVGIEPFGVHARHGELPQGPGADVGVLT